MRRRFSVALTMALVAACAALVAATTATAQATGQLRVVGPWAGADEQSFRAVLDGFKAQNPGVEITYVAASGGIANAVTGDTQADVALMPLPAELDAMQKLARDGTLKQIEFAVPAVRSNYAFAWKSLGTVDGKLYGVFFKASNESGFWYHQSTFQRLGVPATATTWRGLGTIIRSLSDKGRVPFAVSGQVDSVLPNLFENVYMMQQGARKFDMLVRGGIPWNDGSVRDALATMRDAFLGPDKVAGGLGTSLETRYATAVQKVFGSPQRAGMVPGGSAAIPVLTNAKAVRPIAQFGVIPFPTINGLGPARVIGRADAAVMLNDTPAARALIGYLAGPESGAIWAGRGGDFLSPNRKVDLATYRVPATRTLATALTSATVFRFTIAEQMAPSVREAFNRALTQVARNPSQVEAITARLEAAARATAT